MELLSLAILILVTLTTLFVAFIYLKNHNKKYLVFSSVGDTNNVQSWISNPSKKDFDLIIYYYGDKEAPDFDANLIVKRKGLKLDNFYHFLNHHSIESYQSIWLVDDDIIINTESINRMFKIFSEYNLWMAQPSFDKHSQISHAITMNNPSCILRYTNFVEVGVPIFSTKTIPLLMESFNDASTGYGLDYVWTSLLDYPTDKIAIIDAVTCQHPDTGYSALDQIMPRSVHAIQGEDLLKKYALLPSDWQPTEGSPWPTPFTIKEYSCINKNKQRH